MAPIKVAYIAGWGRSGSTLLDMVLGTAEGFFSAGELFRIWQYGIVENGLCGCGERVLLCPHWEAVFERAFGGFDACDVAGILAWQNAAAKTRAIPRVRRVVDTLSADPPLAMRQIGRLYTAIAEHNGSRIIVDSSKHPMYGALLSAISGLDVYVIHLVRNPHALAYSWQRKKLMPDTGRYFRVRPVSETTRHWLSWNAGIGYLTRRLKLPTLVVRYEDFVSQPTQTLREIFTFLNEPGVPLPVSASGEFAMRTHHSIVGNPMKFQTGQIALRLDNEWESALGQRDRRIISAMAWPQMWRYGYL